MPEPEQGFNLLSILVGGVVGSLITLFIQEFLPESLKQEIKIFARRIKIIISNKKVKARFTWKYHLDLYEENPGKFTSSLWEAVDKAGFKLNHIDDYKAEVGKSDRQRIIIEVNYDEEESRLLSIQVKVERELSLRRFEGDILTTIDNPRLKQILNVIRSFLESYRVDIEESRFMEIRLGGLSSLSLLVKGLGLKFAIVDTKYKLIIGDNNNVSLKIDGFTDELSHLLHRIVLLYA